MKTIPRAFYHIPVTVLFFTVVPIFYFLFVLMYNPFGSGELISAGVGYTLHLIITSLIVLGVMVLSRILLFLLRRVLDLNWPLYVLWCVGEAVLCGLFTSIPLGIAYLSEHTYFSVMSQCVLYMSAVLVFPLSILSLSVQAYVLNRQVQLAPAVDEKRLLRFYDEQKRLKLVVASDAVLYIESEDNYVHIVYLFPQRPARGPHPQRRQRLCPGPAGPRGPAPHPRLQTLLRGPHETAVSLAANPVRSGGWPSPACHYAFLVLRQFSYTYFLE